MTCGEEIDLGLSDGAHPDEPAPRASRPPLGALSAAVARLHQQRYGKGPARIRCHAFDDLLVVVLEGGMTHVETALAEAGRGELVTAGREALFPAIQEELTALVEAELRRGVRFSMRAGEPDEDVVALLFVLEPRSEDVRRRAAATRTLVRETIAESEAVRAQSEQAIRRAASRDGHHDGDRPAR